MTGDPTEWMAQANEDLEAGRDMLRAGHHAHAAFLAHQAAEKVLKAIYIDEHQRLWKIHNLVTLADEVGAPEDVDEACKVLTPHYTATRYPDLADDYDEDAASTALDRAEEVMRWARERI